MGIQLDKNLVEKYWEFVAERQRIWHKRYIQKLEFPWTDDEILQTVSFTNNYRSLDPGTQFLYDNVLNEDSINDSVRLFNTLVYRLIGRQRTFELMYSNPEVGLLDPSTFTFELLQKELRRQQLEYGHKVFSIAYLVSGYGWAEGNDKVEKVARLVGVWATNWTEFFNTYKRAVRTKDPHNVFLAILTLDGLGDFLAYQCHTDLSYDRSNFPVVQELLQKFPDTAPKYSSTLGFTNDQDIRWAKAGPGAAAGICALMGNRISEYDAKKIDLPVINYLWAKQVEQLDSCGFPWLHHGHTTTQDGDGDVKLLSFSDIQNTLCEFSKYTRIVNGVGRGRRKFIPPNQRNGVHGLTGRSNSVAYQAPRASLDLLVEEVEYPEASGGPVSAVPAKRRPGRPRKDLLPF